MTILHFLTFLVPLLAVGVQLLLSPEIKPLWMSMKQPWPAVIGAATSVIGTTLASHASGDDWNTAILKGVMGLTTTGLVGHTLTPKPPSDPPPTSPAAALSN